MERFRTYVGKLLSDAVFRRVALVLFSAPFIWISVAGARELGTFATDEWYLWLLFLGVGVIGLVIAYVGLFGRESLVMKIGGSIDPGAAEWLGLILALLVIAVALPATMAIRFFFRAKDNDL